MYKLAFLFLRIFIKYLLHLCEAKVILFPYQNATDKLVQEILFISLEKKLQAVNVVWIKNGTIMALYTLYAFSVEITKGIDSIKFPSFAFCQS